MLFINKNNQFAMSMQRDEGIMMQVLDDVDQHFLAALMHVLMHGNQKKLKKFAKNYNIRLDSTFARYLYIYAMDKVKFENLIWLGNFLGFHLVNWCKIRGHLNWAVENALIPSLIGTSFVYEPDYAVMISNLKKLGANLNHQYKDGFTLLHFVSHFSGPDIKSQQSAIRAILDNGADPNLKNANGQSSLACARNGEIANYLIQQPECKPAFKYTKTSKSVAISSTEFKNKQIYKYCLEHGGVEVAISRIERELIANTIPVAPNSSMNNPAPRRI